MPRTRFSRNAANSRPENSDSTDMKPRSLAWLSFLALAGPAIAAAQEDPSTIVATAVRQAGHPCDKPESVKPDAKHSTAARKAWIIRCESGAYRVRFLPGHGATVVLIGKR
jgi:hypothetical protein